MKCSGDRACIFPVADGRGLCVYHLRDKKEQRSVMGSTMQLVEDVKKQYGFRLGRGYTTGPRKEV